MTHFPLGDRNGGKIIKKVSAVLGVALILAGCAPINLHPTEDMPTVVQTPKKLLDCDLIFPAPARDTLAP